jgi:hypothetical protein
MATEGIIPQEEFFNPENLSGIMEDAGSAVLQTGGAVLSL